MKNQKPPETLGDSNGLRLQGDHRRHPIMRKNRDSLSHMQECQRKGNLLYASRHVKLFVVRARGIEPPRLSTAGFEPTASAIPPRALTLIDNILRQTTILLGFHLPWSQFRQSLHLPQGDIATPDQPYAS